MCRVQFNRIIYLCCPNQQEQQIQTLPSISSNPPRITNTVFNANGGSSNFNSNAGSSSVTSLVNGGYNTNLGFAGPTSSSGRPVQQSSAVNSFSVVPTSGSTDSCGISNEIRVIGGQPVRVSITLFSALMIAFSSLASDSKYLRSHTHTHTHTYILMYMIC